MPATASRTPRRRVKTLVAEPPVIVSVVELVEPEAIEKANDAILKAIIASLPPKPIHRVSLRWTQALLERRIRTLRDAERRRALAEVRYHGMVTGVVYHGQPTMAEVVMERHDANIALLSARRAFSAVRNFLWHQLDKREAFGL